MTDGEIAARLQKRNERGESLLSIARSLGNEIYATEVDRAIRGRVCPKIRKVFNPPRQRTRIICEVPDDLKVWWDERSSEWGGGAAFMEQLRKCWENDWL